MLYIPEVVKGPLSLCLEPEDSSVTDECCSTATLSTFSLSGGSCDGETTISLQGSCFVASLLQDKV